MAGWAGGLLGVARVPGCWASLGYSLYGVEEREAGGRGRMGTALGLLVWGWGWGWTGIGSGPDLADVHSLRLNYNT